MHATLYLSLVTCAQKLPLLFISPGCSIEFRPGYLVPSFNLPQLTLAKCGKPQKVGTQNLEPDFPMPKGILSYFFTLICGAQNDIYYVW